MTKVTKALYNPIPTKRGSMLILLLLLLVETKNLYCDSLTILNSNSSLKRIRLSGSYLQEKKLSLRKMI